ncbi:MAG: hypothetical protein WCH31_09825 [Actinomycetes bacterium]
MSPFAVVMLVAAVALVVSAEWQRIGRMLGVEGLPGRDRRRRKTRLRLVEPESQEFARSVERDLAALPTVEDRD